MPNQINTAPRALLVSGKVNADIMVQIYMYAIIARIAKAEPKEIQVVSTDVSVAVRGSFSTVFSVRTVLLERTNLARAALLYLRALPVR